MGQGRAQLQVSSPVMPSHNQRRVTYTFTTTMQNSYWRAKKFIGITVDIVSVKPNQSLKDLYQVTSLFLAKTS
jgi:hypothetical protein